MVLQIYCIVAEPVIRLVKGISLFPICEVSPKSTVSSCRQMIT